LKNKFIKTLPLLLLPSFIFGLETNNHIGKPIFDNNCVFCHPLNGKGGMGVDINIVSYERTYDEIYSYIQSPGTNFRKRGYKSSGMPEFRLTPTELKDVSDYVWSLQPFKKSMLKNK